MKPDFHSRFLLVASDFYFTWDIRKVVKRIEQNEKKSFALFGFEVQIFQQNLSDFCGHFTRMKKFSQNSRPTALPGLREDKPQYNLKTKMIEIQTLVPTLREDQSLKIV